MAYKQIVGYQKASIVIIKIPRVIIMTQMGVVRTKLSVVMIN